MKVYILKVFAVVPGAPKRDYEGEYPTQYYTDAERASNVWNWWYGDQGRYDSLLLEEFIECPMVGDVVYVPEYVERGR